VIGTVDQFSTAVEGILRHSGIQTTLELHIQEDSDEARAAQELRWNNSCERSGFNRRPCNENVGWIVA